MSNRVATMTGTFLTPGVSKNKRLYTREHISRAVDRLNQRIESGDALPVTMLSYHEAGDNTTQIAGRVTRVGVDPVTGHGTYEADIPNTAVGRDIATLADTSEGKPFVGSVSIRGSWLGKIRKETHDGVPVETADDLEIDGIDFTKTPGVSGAKIKSVTLTQAKQAHLVPKESDGRVPITESFEVQINEADNGPCPTCGHLAETASDSADQPSGESPVSEDTKTAPAATETKTETPARNLTDADVQAIVAALKPAEPAKESAPPTKDVVAETAPASTGLTESAVTELVSKALETQKVELIKQVVEAYGPPSRRGLVESDEEKPDKPLHQMTPEELQAYKVKTFAPVVLPGIIPQ